MVVLDLEASLSFVKAKFVIDVFSLENHLLTHIRQHWGPYSHLSLWKFLPWTDDYEVLSRTKVLNLLQSEWMWPSGLQSHFMSRDIYLPSSNF